MLACHFTTDRASVSTSFLLLLRAFEAQTQLALYALYTKVNEEIGAGPYARLPTGEAPTRTSTVQQRDAPPIKPIP